MWYLQQLWYIIKFVLYLFFFFDVIWFDEIGVQIIGIVFFVVYKIIILQVFDVYIMQVDVVMYMIVDVVISCRFEVIDFVLEEVVLMKILQVMFVF